MAIVKGSFGSIFAYTWGRGDAELYSTLLVFGRGKWSAATL